MPLLRDTADVSLFYLAFWERDTQAVAIQLATLLVSDFATGLAVEHGQPLFMAWLDRKRMGVGDGTTSSRAVSSPTVGSRRAAAVSPLSTVVQRNPHAAHATDTAQPTSKDTVSSRVQNGVQIERQQVMAASGKLGMSDEYIKVTIQCEYRRRACW